MLEVMDQFLLSLLSLAKDFRIVTQVATQWNARHYVLRAKTG